MRHCDPDNQSIRPAHRTPQASATIRPLALAVLLPLAAACAQGLPLPELRAYNDAVAQARTASDAILDDYALVEVPTAEDDTTDADEFAVLTFSAEDALAAFYREQHGGDPPDTALRREVFASIEDYNTVLLHLAEGRSVDDLSAEIDGIGASLAQIAASAGLASTGGLGAGLGALQSVLAAIERERSRASALSLWLEGTPTILAMIDYLQSEAAPMFEVITAEIALTLLSVDDADVERKAELVTRLEQYQRVFTEYVGLLEHVRLAIADVNAALAAETQDGAAVDRLSDRAREIGETVRTIREAFARMRTAA